MKLTACFLFSLLGAPALWAADAPLLPIYEALKAGNAQLAQELMVAAQGNLRHNQAFFELCQTAVEQGDAAFFAGMPAVYINELCGPVPSPFAAMDDTPKATAYFAPPLLHAAAAGKAEIVQVLLQRGADIGEAEYYDRTAIEYAAANGHLPCVELLHRAGATRLEHALQAAFEFNQTEVAAYLLRHGVVAPALNEAFTQRSLTGETALMCALADCELGRMEFLLSLAPQQLNMQNAYGETALMQAVAAENLAAVLLLLKYGADTTIKNDSGLTPLDAAYKSANPFVVEALTVADAPATQPQLALRHACENGDVELARRVLSAGGVNVNELPVGGCTLLALAVDAQSEPLVQLLIEHGAKVANASALYMAVYTDQPEMVRLFMPHTHVCPRSPRGPANMFSEQQKLNALLHVACRYNAVKTARMMLQLGAEVNDNRMCARSHDGLTRNTPLHAAACGSEELISLLLAAGANINARNSAGDTPLILAAKFRNAEPFTPTADGALLLLERGADASLRNNDGKSAADYAWNQPLVQALARAGVHPAEPEPDCMSPLQLAYIVNDVELFDHFLQSGMDPDVQTGGNTLLQTLLRNNGNAEYARMLIAAGADVQRCSEDFAVAMGRAHTEVARALLEGGFTVQPRGAVTREYLSRALYGRAPQRTLPLLVQAGADINAEDARGFTLLMELATDASFVEYRFDALLQMQPDLEIPLQGSTAEWNALTALDLAVKKGNLEQAYRLLLAGAKATPCQVQAIFFHVLRVHPDKAQDMVNRFGASPTAPEPSTGLTPIELLTRSGHPELL